MTELDDSFERLFDAAPDAMLIVDPEGRIRLANDRVDELFGYAPSELEGEHIEVLVPERLRDEHVAYRDGYFDEPIPRPMGAGLDLSAQRMDGSTFPIDISLSPVTAGDDVYALATVRDISEQQTLQRKYRSLLETMPDAVVVADSESGEITEVNEAATVLFDRNRADLVGSHQVLLHPAGQSERYRELFERHVEADHAIVSKFPDGADVLVETGDGTHIPVEINARVTQLDDRQVIVGVFRDISERRAQKRELERQLDRVETLIKILSHDLRGPLNVAEGYLEEVRETTDSPMLGEVHDAHQRMEAIIDDVVIMLRNAGNPEVEPVRLGPVATDCWSSIARDCYTLELVDDAVIEADPKQLAHVFENLFRNAVTHAGEDVTVRVGVLAVEEGFYVEDDGTGIPGEERADVFEPGFSTRPDGTGLGLIIVQEIAAFHDWDVAITESPAGGARFEVSNVDVLEVALE